MSISVLGSGAFGTALAIALSRDGTAVTLWSRDPEEAARMQSNRQSGARLPGHDLPAGLAITNSDTAFTAAICLVAVPAQAMAEVLEHHTFPSETSLVACCKGIDRTSGLGPVATLRAACPRNAAAILTGPSFAVDIARGLPTAIVLATEQDDDAENLQAILTRPTLRLYRTTDVIGAELGGALKNVVALAAGIAIGAGLGDSARASVIARGFAEILRYAMAKGAELETLRGLSGLGDLVLTCTSEKSRNFATGMALGRGDPLDAHKTVEGLTTAPTVAREAMANGLDLPLIQAISDVVDHRLDIPSAIQTLLARPVGME